MIKSMTGYGKAEAVLAGRKFLIEMKSVNHRFLEISLRMPGMLLPLEGEIKKRIGEQFSRGRIEATLRMDGDGSAETAGRFTLNLPLVRNYHALLCQLKEEFHLGDEVTLAMMAGFRDVFVPAETVQDPAALWEGLSKILAEAIRTLTEMREKEGESLKRDLTGRLDLIAGFLEGIAGRAPQVVLDYQKRLDRPGPGTDGRHGDRRGASASGGGDHGGEERYYRRNRPFPQPYRSVYRSAGGGGRRREKDRFPDPGDGPGDQYDRFQERGCGDLAECHRDQERTGEIAGAGAEY